MPDLVVTVPMRLWQAWLAEGDLAGGSESGTEWGFSVGRPAPPAGPGSRLYIVAWRHLRGYAPVTRIRLGARGWVICRKGGAVAVTLPDLSGAPARIAGFQGWLERWWKHEDEVEFPEWRTLGVGVEPSAFSERRSAGGGA